MDEAQGSDTATGRVHIRLANRSDVHGIAELYRDFLAAYGHHAEIDTMEPFISGLLEEAWVRILVAINTAGEVVGFLGGSLTYSAISQRPAFAINDLFVARSARRHGIATALLAGIEDHAKKNGISKLFVEAASSVAAATRLYEKAGFKIDPYISLRKELLDDE